MWRVLFMLTVCCSVFCSGCYTEPEQSAASPVPSMANSITACHPKYYQRCYESFLARAQKGDPVAQNNLGRMYADGRGVPQDLSAAISWFTRAAKQDNIDSEISLGVAYLFGKGVSADRRQACHWLYKAEKQHDQQARQVYGNYCIV